MNPEDEALLCARAAEWIYGSDTDQDGQRFCTSAMDGIGFKDLLWHNFITPLRDICVLAATSDHYHILAFRGTKVPQDWMTDLACSKVGFENIFPGTPALGDIHAGFGSCLAPALMTIQRILTRRSMSKPLLISGHSLGGALAALVAVYFAVARPKVKVPEVRRIYTFGQPRIGVEKFCTTYGRFVLGKLVRFVNNRDLVPRVPLRSQMFADGGTMIHFDSSGAPRTESAEWNDFLKLPFGTIGEVLDMIATGKDGIADHSMQSYRELIEQNQSRLAVLLPKL